MVRTKQIGKRTRVDPDAPPAPPRLSQMPVESWFEENDQITAYQERLSRMEILVPKYLAEDVLPEAEYYPRFVAAAYTTISIFDTLRADGTGPAASGKYLISRMSTTHRLLLYMVSYVLLPRKRNHGTATKEDLPIIWAMAQEKQINWPYLIAHKMVKYSRGVATASLGLAHLWTRILESLDFDLTRER
ncbi:hypothetical protein PIB30_074514, partial [Stylosanthes scabra]|nr:hypothetical protein [Stylosanthes scabra]